MNASGCGRGISPTMRERRTVDVVKSVLTKVKERMFQSSPLLVEEEAVINQLEQLFAKKFAGPASDILSSSDNTRRESDQFSSALQDSCRRDSDASFSNETHSSSIFTFTPLKGRPPKTKDRDYYTGRDPWRRHWQRRKRLELRKLVKPLPLRVDEAKGSCLVNAVRAVYDELLRQGKPTLAAYDLLITTLRSHFTRDTWPDLVDVYAVQFIQDHILLSAVELETKYSNGFRGSVDRIDEYKLQALLHLYALPLDADPRGEELDEVVLILRYILSSFGGNCILEKFLDEEILETFLDTSPRDLVRIYQELNISLPTELSTVGATGSGMEQQNGQLGSQTKEKERLPKRRPVDVTPKKRGRPPKAGGVALAAIFHKSVRDKLEPIRVKKVRRSLDDIEEVVEPKSRNVEKPKDPLKTSVSEGRIREMRTVAMEKATTPVIKALKEEPKDQQSKKRAVYNEKEVPSRLKKSKFSESHPVGKLLAETTDAVLVSVRQSPRQHASTRALYGNASNTLSLLLQKEQADETCRNGCLARPATTTELLNDSTRLVLVKDKRGYFLKNFLHDGNRDSEHRDSKSLKAMPSKSKKSSSKNKKEKPLMESDQQKEPQKVLGKLTLKIKKVPIVAAKQEKIEETSYPAKSEKKPPNGRKNGHQRIVITKMKGPGNSGPSFIVSPGRTSRNGKKASGRSDQLMHVKSSTKLEKLSSVDMEKYEMMSPKSSRTKSDNAENGNPAYVLPPFAVDNYVKHISDIRRERKRAMIDPEDELFYARGTRRHSIFYDGVDAGIPATRASVSKYYSDEHMAPKNRSGRKMKSSVEVFHLANYLLNIRNANPTEPTIPKNLQQALNTPIRLYKKLRLAPKNSRRRSLRQFCSLKFNADEFKLSVDSGSGASNSGAVDEDRSANDTDECGSVELNCGEPRATTPKQETKRNDLKLTLTINTKLIDISPRRNSVSICAGLAKPPPMTWTVNGTSLNGQEEHSAGGPKNGYFLRRRRLFSDGHVSSAESSIISPGVNGVKRPLALTGRGEEFEVVKKKFKELKNGDGGLMLIGSQGGVTSRRGSLVAQEQEFYMIGESLCGQLLDRRGQAQTADGTKQSGGSFLNRLTSHASGLLQLANPSPLLCAGLTSKNYTQVAADVR